MIRRIAGAALVITYFFLVEILSSLPGNESAKSSRSVVAPGAASNGAPPAEIKNLISDFESLDKTPNDFLKFPLAFLSRAPLDSLILLKGIGPVLADRVIQARTGKGPFTSWKDLLEIKGIGPKKISKFKELSEENQLRY